IGLKVIETGEANNSPDDNGKDPVMATISMSLPLNQKKYGDLEKSAIKKYQASIHHKKNRQNELSTQLALTLFEFHDHHRKLTLYRDTLIPKARQSLKITLQAYRNNKADFLDLIDIQRQLLQFQLMKEKSFTEIHRQSAILEELTGGKHLQSGENHE
ncbi:MAG: TolC family protein, partial [Lentisphaeraceae bacterium]|nr:TolC family protein [Lentisphaeraceae bacterium]